MTDEKQLNLKTLLEGIPSEVGTLKEFVSSAREARQRILKVNPSQDFYLTGCTGCCGHYGISYRFFAGMPRFSSHGHADTGNRGFIVKTYNKPDNLNKDLAYLILHGEDTLSIIKIGLILYGQNLPPTKLDINEINTGSRDGKGYRI